jgi:hypothetical protein
MKKKIYVCEGTASVLPKYCSLFIETVRKERHCCRLERMSGFWRQSRKKTISVARSLGIVPTYHRSSVIIKTWL